MSRDDHNDTFTSGMAVWAAAVLRQSRHVRARGPMAATVPMERTTIDPGPVADRFFAPMGRDWLEHAACADADPRIFDFEGEADFDLSPEWEPAERYCKRCPVRGPCRRAGLGLPGMWGGKPNLVSPRQGSRGRPGSQVQSQISRRVLEGERVNNNVTAMVAATTGQLTEGDGNTMTATLGRQSEQAVDGPTANLRTVTPEVAATWLAANTGNRNLSKPLVTQYARDMAAGRWTLNGEAVQISVTGRLLNGQHRLKAIIEAGVTLPLVVVTNLPDDAQDTMDKGRKRNLADTLALANYANAVPLASIAALAFQVKHGSMYRPSDAEKRQLIDDDQTLQWVCANVVGSLPRHLASRTVLGYAYLVLHKIDPDECATFFSKLDTLTNLPEGSPILALHKRLTGMERRSSAWSDRTYVLTLIYLAWNAWRKGENRSLIKVYPKDDGTFNIPTPV